MLSVVGRQMRQRLWALWGAIAATARAAAAPDFEPATSFHAVAYSANTGQPAVDTTISTAAFASEASFAATHAAVGHVSTGHVSTGHVSTL